MAKGSLRLILPVFAALGVACGFEPEPRVLTRLEVKPTNLALLIVAPANTCQLTIAAYDQDGAAMPGTGAATYASSAPAIAWVTNSGLVTAAAPGAAQITAALTLGGITRTASMLVTVHPHDYSDIAGVYDLTALITTFDPAGGEDLTGYRYTAVLTLWQEWDAPWLPGGTYADLRLISPGGETTLVNNAGSVTASIDSSGRLVVELVHDQNPEFHLTLLVATLDSGFIDGTFGHAHIGGTFTATRR